VHLPDAVRAHTGTGTIMAITITTTIMTMITIILTHIIMTSPAKAWPAPPGRATLS
jgi:hypothetical protein